MAVSVALSAGALALAANAENTAEIARCRSVLGAHHAASASVEQMRDYAGCVYRVYGDGAPLTDWQTMLLKAAIVICFVGLSGGAVFGYRFGDKSIGDAVDAIAGAIAGGLLGGCFAAAACLVAWLAYMGIAFLFS